MLGEEKQILLSPAGWLNDNLIMAAQKILKKTILSCWIPGYYLWNNNVMTEEFVQILHDGSGHWFTVSTIGARKSNEVFVYDSMYSHFGYPLWVHTQKKKWLLLLSCKERKKSKSIRWMCSFRRRKLLWPLCYCLCNGSGEWNTTSMHTACSISEMRQHLYSYEPRKESPSQKKLKKSGVLVKSRYVIRLYCSCRMPEVKTQWSNAQVAKNGFIHHVWRCQKEQWNRTTIELV